MTVVVDQLTHRAQLIFRLKSHIRAARIGRFSDGIRMAQSEECQLRGPQNGATFSGAVWTRPCRRETAVLPPALKGSMPFPCPSLISLMWARKECRRR
jgi:hypothetical protein